MYDLETHIITKQLERELALTRARRRMRYQHELGTMPGQSWLNRLLRRSQAEPRRTARPVGSIASNVRSAMIGPVWRRSKTAPDP